MSAGAHVRTQLRPALLQRAVRLEPVHDPVQRRRVDAELAADLAHGDAGARFDHLEELVAATIAAPSGAGVARGGRSRTPAPPARRRRGVSRGRRSDAEALCDLLELAVLVHERTELRHAPRDAILQALQVIDD